MNKNQTFEKFQSKLTLEAVLNSVLLSLSIGLFADGLISLICWLSGYDFGIWVAIGVGAGIALVAYPFIYFFKFRPTEQQISRRVDALGLQERAVTMLDFKDSQSDIAEIQRSDAIVRIDGVSAKSIKICVRKWIGIMFAVAFVFGVIFDVVAMLFTFDIIDSPIANDDPRDLLCEVTYAVEDGGEIIGESDQLVTPGEDATTVTAIAMDGYIFLGWDDGYQNPERTDLKITENFFVTAQFEAIQSDPDGADSDLDGPGNGDEASDQPSDGEGQGDGGEGDGNGSPGNSEGSGSGDQEGEGDGDGQGQGAGGKFSESNKIINGEIYYRDLLDGYYEDAMRDLASRDDIPEEIREFIEAYLESV